MVPGPRKDLSVDNISPSQVHEPELHKTEQVSDTPIADVVSPVPSTMSADVVIYKVDPPPSVELRYKVEAVRGGQTIFGESTIRWINNGQTYSINGDTRALFFSLLSFKSEGSIDMYGVSPEFYSEKKFRKSETNTHFHHERNTISFSASTTSYPRQGGEQDRASIIWQLSGIGRGDRENIFPGAQFDIFVAGVRDGETWHIHVMDREQVEVNGQSVGTWHLIRMPLPESYEQTLDIWLAPLQEWFPVKLRFTEANGDTIDMSLSEYQLLGPELY